MFTNDLVLGLQLWLVILVFGLITLPLSSRVFSNLFDKGYFLGKMLGLLVVSYISFTLASFKILPLGFNSLILLAIIWGIFNIFIFLKTKQTALNWKIIIIEEALFLILNSIFIFIKGHQPEIYQIERFMDYAFIKALTQSNFLPLEDVWRAGEPLNYYYFGHFLAYVLITLSKVGTVAGFFLVQCWVFSLAGVLAFVAGSSLVKSWLSSKLAILTGLISLFATVFAGDWQTAWWFIENIKPFAEGLTLSNYWYPSPTRIIPGTISEIPIYSFIVADLHAHVWGFLLGATIVCVLISLWQQKLKPALVLPFLSILLGISIMTNTWDFLTSGSIVFLTLLFSLRQTNLIKQASQIILCFAGALIIALPWLISFKSPVAGIGLVTKWSPPLEWFQFWGPSVVLMLLFFLANIKKRIIWSKEGLLIIIFFVSICWLAFLEIIYMKDILNGGEWFRANTYFKISLQLLLWFGMLTGPALIIVLGRARGKLKLLIAVFVSCWLLSRVVYPIKAINQSSLEGKAYTGIGSGLNFWQTKYPDDFAAFKFLETKERGVILEADGDSYQDTSLFSSILGWPTVTGWAVHEWTWHGSFDEVGARAAEVREVYTGADLKKSQDILKKYKVKYIIVSSTERRKYTDLKLDKLLKLGKIIYQPNLSSTIVISPNEGLDR